MCLQGVPQGSNVSFVVGEGLGPCSWARHVGKWCGVLVSHRLMVVAAGARQCQLGRRSMSEVFTEAEGHDA